jgi:hypothetical protein
MITTARQTEQVDNAADIPSADTTISPQRLHLIVTADPQIV